MLKLNNFPKQTSNQIIFLPLFCYSSFSSINKIHTICKEVGLFTYVFTLYIRVSILYLLTFLYVIIIRIHVNLIISDLYKELSSLRMKNSNRKYKLRTSLFIARINHWGHILIQYSIYK